MVDLRYLERYNTHINKGNLKGFCGEELMSVGIFRMVCDMRESPLEERKVYGTKGFRRICK